MNKLEITTTTNYFLLFLLFAYSLNYVYDLLEYTVVGCETKFYPRDVKRFAVFTAEVILCESSSSLL